MDTWLCGHAVARTTDYLEGALKAADCVSMAGHLSECAACTAHLGQVQTAMLLAAVPPPESLPEQLESNLLARYRERAASVTV